MPQVDIVTFFPVIFWFCFILIISFFTLNFWTFILIIFDKKNIIILEKILLDSFINTKIFYNFFNLFENNNLELK